MKKLFLLCIVVLLIITIVATRQILTETHSASAQTTTGSISGRLFYDTQENGKLDSGEQGFNQLQGASFPHVIEALNKNNNARIAETTANPDGSYQLSNLPLGITYRIRMNIPSTVTAYIPTIPLDHVFILDQTHTSKVVDFGFTSTTTPATNVPPGNCYLNLIPPPFGQGNLKVIVRINPDLSLFNQNYAFYSVLLSGTNDKTGPFTPSGSYPFRSYPGQSNAIFATSYSVNGDQMLGNNSTIPPQIGVTRKGVITCSLTYIQNDTESLKTSSTATFSVIENPDLTFTWTTNTALSPTITPTGTNVTQTGNTCNYAEGDINCDGSIDIVDFNLWKTGFLKYQH